MDNINVVTIFWSVVLLIMIIFVFSHLNITLGIIFGTGIALLIIWYIYTNDISQQQEDLEIIKHKQKMIIPQQDASAEYNEITNFLFSIQDFYYYNPQAYEDVVESMDKFFELYQESKNDNSIAGTNYQTMIDNRRDIMNSLQSICFKMLQNVKYDAKLQLSIDYVNNILQKYIDEVKEINAKYNYDFGLNLKSIIINSDPTVPYNTYNDELFTYELY